MNTRVTDSTSGGHRFISKNNDLVDNVCRMMGDELLISNRRSVVLLKGKSFNYPLSAQDIFLKMDIWTNLKAFTSYLIAVVSKALLQMGINAALDIISNNLCKREDTQLMDSEDELVWGDFNNGIDEKKFVIIVRVSLILGR